MNQDSKNIAVGSETLSLADLGQALYQSSPNIKLSLPSREKIDSNHQKLKNAIANNETIYGVTTGFGDSSRRIISGDQASQLQSNLITYLSCGVGDLLPLPVCRAVTLFRLQSLSRGVSAVSFDLLKRMQWMVEEDIVPQIPSQGSLGASGDLVPLAYLALAVQGKGQVWHQGKSQAMEDVCKQYDQPPYELKPKEGLALVNGTSVMAAYSYHNLKVIRFLLETTMKTTALCVLGINGRKEAFNPLINNFAKQFFGQSLAAQRIWSYLENESYQSPQIAKVHQQEERDHTIQDKYSIRCAPQILGPIFDTLQLCEEWTEKEASGVSDNPIIQEGEEFSMGGNFYGGYISHGMDYLKISMAHMADMIDRQFMCLIDEAVNRGLPPNLADWEKIPEDERYLNHGLKGLNQAMSAITSEVMAQSTPGGLFSRSSESHNQDKVSLGLSACIQAEKIFNNMFNLLAIHLVGCAQAIDLRKTQLKDPELIQLYEMVRSHSPMVHRDRRLDKDIHDIASHLKQLTGVYIAAPKV